MRHALAIIAIAAVALAVQPASAELPPLPQRFYGLVTVNGVAPADGTRITVHAGSAECGRTETIGGAYRLDAPAPGAPAACSASGRPLRFMVAQSPAPQTAIWEGARFTELHLSATAAHYAAAALDLESPCIPAPGRAGCDSARFRLWSGEPEAWRLLFEALGAPAPSPDRVFDETLQLRLAAGDPAITSRFATALAWPYIRITLIQFRGTAPGDADEYVEIANLGGGAQEMTGWRLRSLSSGAEFRFRQGATLAAGQRCRIYTARVANESCPGFGFGSTHGLWDDQSDTALLTVDFPSLVADVTHYRASPAQQLPPPALRGTSPVQ